MLHGIILMEKLILLNAQRVIKTKNLLYFLGHGGMVLVFFRLTLSIIPLNQKLTLMRKVKMRLRNLAILTLPTSIAIRNGNMLIDFLL